MEAEQEKNALPIEAYAEEIRRAIETHRVVVVSGDTGSGKTTRLPGICLKAGGGTRGRIAVTQPRRLACVAMARRVAEESGTELGAFVGFRHRFEKKVSKDTVIEFLTDGTLLAETRNDRNLDAYDTIVLDEAHERSLNIDFLLGVLKRILERRRNLRLVISSATLDVERFSEFFGGAPIISVPGRLYPIETRWSGEEDEDADMSRRIADAAEGLLAEGLSGILVFLPGERDIREAAEVLAGRRLKNTQIIPLTASLPAGEQQRAFTVSSERRIILSTNVAETSVTLPGIQGVIDTGLARIKRYNPRTRVQRLQIEPISQASADQRRGRCGRVGPGICVRLYGKADFANRDKFTPPEVLRSPLSGVILSMLDLRLGDIEEFPFIDAPPMSLIRDGYAELLALGAVSETELLGDGHWRMTKLGRRLASLPLDPAMGRAIFAAEREGMLNEALIIAASLSCDDPRRRPMEERERADAAHARFLTAESDFLAILKLWNWYHAPCAETRSISPFAIPAGSPPSMTAQRKLCKENFLSFSKMRQWRELHAQLKERCNELSLRNCAVTLRDEQERSDALHRALLAGMVTRIGKRDAQTGEYRGTRSTVFTIFPGSGLAKKRQPSPGKRRPGEKPPAVGIGRDWILAADLVDTSRLFARTVACIKQEWIEAAASAICKSSYHSPEWDARNGFVRIRQRVTLQGLTIVDGRLRDASKIIPEEAREIFIRHGLVGAEFPEPRPRFLKRNAALRARLLDMEAKQRRHGALYDEERVFAFYDERIPREVNNAAALRRYLASARADEGLILPEPVRESDDRWPDAVTIDGLRFALVYRHAPGEEDDGITCHVPAGAEQALKSWRHEWLVPGMLDEKLNWMLTSLPGKTRRLLLPIRDTLQRLHTYLTPGRGNIAEEVAKVLDEKFGIRVDPAVWAEEKFPPHLRVHFSFAGGKRGAVASRGEAVVVRGRPVEENWSLPDTVEVGSAGWKVNNTPALKIGADGEITIENFADSSQAAVEHEKAVLALIIRQLGKEWRRLIQPPRLDRALTLYLVSLETTPAKLGEDLAIGALRGLFVEEGGVPRSAEGLREAMARKGGGIASAIAERTSLVLEALRDAERLEGLLVADGLAQETVEDIQLQLVWLLHEGFARLTPAASLKRLPCYLKAAFKRIERARTNPSGDVAKIARFAPHWKRYEDIFELSPRPRYDAAKLREYRWMLEELRISLFAQELRTAYPVSDKRLDAVWSKVFDH